MPVPQPLAACKMLKVIKRTRLAKAQAERRKARKNAKNLRDRVAVTAQQNNFLWLEHHKAVKRAKDHHKEDWELGPLAPRRDVGDLKDKYGALSQHLLESPQLTSEERKKRIARFAGKGPRNFPYCNIRKGDRVVLLSGRDKGKIGKIRDVDLNKGEVKVEGLNKVDAAIPEWVKKSGMEYKPFESVEKAISFDDIRLVTALYDPATKETRDVVVKETRTANWFTDRVNRKTTWDRRIAGTEIKIPWPKEVEQEVVQHPCDTKPLDVDRITFVPTLIEPPMPPAVLDELRNKFSKFRTRHTAEYIEEKIAEEEEKRLRLSLATMRTPLQWKNRKDRKERRKKGKGVLTESMLAALGEVMVKNMGLKATETIAATIPPPQTPTVQAEAPVVMNL